MRKILITGGAGFVGRRMTKKFLDLGDEVHCVDSVAPLSGGIEPERVNRYRRVVWTARFRPIWKRFA